MTLIGLTGYAQVGKDSVGKILVERGFTRVAFADGVREAVTFLDPLVPVAGFKGVETMRIGHLVSLVGWDRAKVEFPEARRLLQAMGTEVCRAMFGGDCWIEYAFSKMNPSGDYVITDVRFPNEAQTIKERGGEIWRVYRPGTGPQSDHPSEVLLDDIAWDRSITNDGPMEALEEKVEALL